VLQHQLRILDRRGKRARYGAADRAFLAAGSRFLPRERWSAFPVVPETLKRWRRQLEARKDPRRRRRGPGRPPIDPALRELILRLGRENPRWGYVRIKGELLKLGITVSATTIANVLRRGGLGPAPRRVGPTWGEFLRAQAVAFLPNGTSASYFEDRARHESGPAPGLREATSRPVVVEECRPDEAPAASDPTGDWEPTREEPFISRLHEQSPIRGVHRLPCCGARPRDGPIPAHLRLVALPEHRRFARLHTARPTAQWLPPWSTRPIAPHWRHFDSAA
jgi:Homeodomain-like domain